MDGVIDNKIKLILAVCLIADLIPRNFGERVIRNKEVKFFIRIGLPPADNLFPIGFQVCIRLDVSHRLALQSLNLLQCGREIHLRNQRCNSLFQRNGRGKPHCCERRSHRTRSAAVSALVLRRARHIEDDDRIERCGIIDGIGRIRREPSALALHDVVLRVMNNVVAAVIVRSLLEQVLRAQLLLHRENEIFRIDGRAVIPFQIVAQRNTECLSARRINPNAEFSRIFRRYVFKLGRRGIIDGVLVFYDPVNIDRAVVIELAALKCEVELVERTLKIRITVRIRRVRRHNIRPDGRELSRVRVIGIRCITALTAACRQHRSRRNRNRRCKGNGSDFLPCFCHFILRKKIKIFRVRRKSSLNKLFRLSSNHKYFRSRPSEYASDATLFNTSDCFRRERSPCTAERIRAIQWEDTIVSLPLRHGFVNRNSCNTHNFHRYFYISSFDSRYMQDK